MAVWSIVRRRSARRVATRLAASAVVAAVAAMGLATTAAAQGGFTDVTSGSHGSHKANIEALAEMGLFEGAECGEQQFCPNDPALRWTVAVWIVRALEGGSPPEVAESRFADVDDDVWWMPYVERLADLQITVGCKRDPLRFCPDETVTRARMATFLVRAFDLAEAPSAGFADTGGSSHEANIDALFTAGITVGCRQDPLRYCPNSPVSRAQMATLLRRGMDARPEPASFTIEAGPRSGDTLISAARDRTCAVRLDGGVTCWGQEGLLNRLSTASLENVAALSIGNDPDAGLHACAVHTDGTVSCWGAGFGGQLGQGDTGSHYLPVTVAGITDATLVAAGPDYTCALHQDGTVSCWGINWSRESGGHTHTFTPQRVPGLADVVAISAGRSLVCAVHGDGGLSCWSWIWGDAPARVQGLGAVSSVSVDWRRTCATTADGAVHCPDPGSATGGTGSRVVGISDAVEISASDDHACVLHRGGGVSCWGRNDVGQVGDGTTIDQPRPVRLASISDAVAVSVSSGGSGTGAHSCALHRDGSVSCWGGNEAGQLEDGTTADALAPKRIKRFAGFTAGQVPATQTDLLRSWADILVAEREAAWPWLRVAWDFIREEASFEQSGFGGRVHTYCQVDHAGTTVYRFSCGAARMVLTELSAGSLVHELMHVYDLHTGLAPSRAWGAVQLYFATTYPGCFAGLDRHGAEILADTTNHLVVPGSWLTYYNSPGCPTLPEGSEPTLEAEQVLLQGLAGQVPDWYTENITNGAELWAAWLRGPSMPALANLADEFGGLCNLDWISTPLDPERFPPADSNPFRDGGC